MTKNEKLAAFPLRLPQSTHRQAIEIAGNDGISLNQFITIAVAEMIVRWESHGHEARAQGPSRSSPRGEGPTSTGVADGAARISKA